MKYQTFQLLVDFGGCAKWIDVCAIDISSAKADVQHAYFDCKVIQWEAK